VPAKQKTRPAPRRSRKTSDNEHAPLIYLAWSGERSKQVALALHEALPMICNAFNPWMSEVDIALGTAWREEIAARLDEAQAAILCLTPENQDEPWVLFEAGAVAKARTKSRVIPYLFGLAARDLKPPLSDFQAATSALDKGQNLKMVRSLYKALPDAWRVIDEKRMEASFALAWEGRLQPGLSEIPTTVPANPPPRRDGEVLDDVLSLVRGLVQKGRRQEVMLEVLLEATNPAASWEAYARNHPPLSNSGRPKGWRREGMLKPGLVPGIPPGPPVEDESDSD
jgi:hypothetical protein